MSFYCELELSSNFAATRSYTMADSNESRPVVRATKPVSETLLNEKVQPILEFPPVQIVIYELFGSY